MARAAWYKALNPQVSGVSTDVMLFSDHGSPLVHHYRVLGRIAAHASLRGTFMTKLWVFTVRAAAEAKWEAGRAPNNMTPSESPPVIREYSGLLRDLGRVLWNCRV